MYSLHPIIRQGRKLDLRRAYCMATEKLCSEEIADLYGLELAPFRTWCCLNVKGEVKYGKRYFTANEAYLVASEYKRKRKTKTR